MFENLSERSRRLFMLGVVNAGRLQYMSTQPAFTQKISKFYDKDGGYAVSSSTSGYDVYMNGAGGGSSLLGGLSFLNPYGAPSSFNVTFYVYGNGILIGQHTVTVSGVITGINKFSFAFDLYGGLGYGNITIAFESEYPVELTPFGLQYQFVTNLSEDDVANLPDVQPKTSMIVQKIGYAEKVIVMQEIIPVPADLTGLVQSVGYNEYVNVMQVPYVEPADLTSLLQIIGYKEYINILQVPYVEPTDLTALMQKIGLKEYVMVSQVAYVAPPDMSKISEDLGIKEHVIVIQEPV